jgi:hypothetical protein
MNVHGAIGFGSIGRRVLPIIKTSVCSPSTYRLCAVHDGTIPGLILFYTSINLPAVR